jgi:hypothetical protein
VGGDFQQHRRTDVNNSGSINATDVLQIKAAAGMTLP